MKKFWISSLALAALVALGLLMGGCGGGEQDAAPAEKAAETVAVHDCAGGCGMEAVAEEKMTEVDGKWYCAGCAKKAQQDHEHEEGDGHEGHDHG